MRERERERERPVTCFQRMANGDLLFVHANQTSESGLMGKNSSDETFSSSQNNRRFN